MDEELVEWNHSVVASFLIEMKFFEEGKSSVPVVFFSYCNVPTG